MTSSQTCFQASFNTTALRADQLIEQLGSAHIFNTNDMAKVWLSAVAALAPHMSQTDIIGAWPLHGATRKGRATAAGWWHLLTNLGFEVTTPSHSPLANERTCWCSLQPDGDIWISFDTIHIWQSRTQTIFNAPRGLPKGNWVLLLARDKAEHNPITTTDILLGGLRPVLPSLLMGSLLVQGLGVMVPVFIMVVYDHIIDGRAEVGYNGLLVGLGCILLLEAMLRRIRGKILVNAGLRAESAWVNRIVAQLIHLPAALVERASLSSQISRLRGVDIFRDMATSPIVLGVLDVPFVAVVLLTLFFVAGELVLVPLALICAYIAFIFACLPWVKSVLRKQASITDQQQSLVLEASQHQLSLRADGLTDVWLTRIESNGRQAMRLTSSSTFMQHFLEVASLFGSSMAGLLTLYVGIDMVQNGQLSAGGLVAAMMLVWRMLSPLSLMCTALPRLVQLFQTALQLSEFLNIPTETPPLAPPSPMQLPQPTPRGEITLTGVTLRYMREHATVLNNLSATLAPGQLAVIMGGNGSGKSTLLKVLVGLYPVQTGVIRLDGIDTRQWDPERLRSHIAYLPQQPDVFTDTVATNLRLANPLATDAMLWKVLERADAAETVRQFNMGLDESLTGLNVPEMFTFQLSLARLYLHQGPVVLCDELPATLMAQTTGQNFLDWVLEQHGHRTIIIVSNNRRLVEAANLGIGLVAESPALVGQPTHVLHRLQATAPAPTLQPFTTDLSINPTNIAGFSHAA